MLNKAIAVSVLVMWIFFLFDLYSTSFMADQYKIPTYITLAIRALPLIVLSIALSNTVVL